MASELESQISSDSQTESDELRGVHGFHLRIAQVRACCNFEKFDSKSAPASFYRCLRISCASVIMVLSSLGAFLLLGTCRLHRDVGSFDCEIGAATRHLDMSYWGLLASTTVAGCGAMWLWCHAATPHLIQASRFLILNWIEGLVGLSMILSTRTYYDDGILYLKGNYDNVDLDGSWASILLMIRAFLLVCELVSLQALIQNRLQSIWPALQRPRHGVWLRRLLWPELALLILSLIFIVPGYLATSATSLQASLPAFAYFLSCLFSLGTVAVLVVIPSCFVVWVLLVFMALCLALSIFRATLKMVQDASPESSRILRRSRRAASLQGFGLVISLASTCFFTGVAVFFVVEHSQSFVGLRTLNLVPLLSAQITQCVNLVVNTVGVIAFSGAYRLWSLRGSSTENSAKTRGFTKCCAWPTRPHRRPVQNLGGGSEWEAKVRELAGRGISLRELLRFYRRLGSEIMLSYQSDVHTTNDVVRLAIIPLTAASCSSYAELVNGNESLMPKKMVTHNWSNLFRDLLASVVADAIGEHTFELISALLSDEAGVNALEQIIELQGNLEVVYWICAFSVNQHAGICGENPRGDVDPVTMLPHPVCSCRRPKFFNETPPLNDSGESILCEMNKFDDMMSFLASTDPSFSEVVASPSMAISWLCMCLFWWFESTTKCVPLGSP